MKTDSEAVVESSNKVDKDLIASALNETIHRYPDSLSAMVFFMNAAGLNELKANDIQMTWFENIMDKMAKK